MRPRIKYDTKERLEAVAREECEGLPSNRDVTDQECLTALLDKVESAEFDGEEVQEPEFQVGTGVGRGGDSGPDSFFE